MKNEEFSGLIGNIAGNMLRDGIGGNSGNLIGGLISNIGGGGRGGGGGGGGSSGKCHQLISNN